MFIVVFRDSFMETFAGAFTYKVRKNVVNRVSVRFTHGPYYSEI